MSTQLIVLKNEFLYQKNYELKQFSTSENNDFSQKKSMEKKHR